MAKDKKIGEFFLPTHIIFGPGSIGRLGEETSKWGKKVLLVTGKKSLAQSGVREKILKDLEEKGMEVVLFEGVESDPSIDTVDRGVKVAEEEKVEVVVGIGGGSVLDCAKAVAGVAGKGRKTEEFLEGVPLPPPSLPFIAVPTTAGTGAEVTNNAVLTHPGKVYKKSLRAKFLLAKVALVDASLTLSLPPQITAYCGMDTLTQLIESYVTLPSNPITDALSLKGIELVKRSLVEAVKNGKNLSAREDMSMASLLSGIALTNSGLGAVHGLAHPLGARWKIPHGLACALLLPFVVRYNLPVREEKYSRIAEILTGSANAYYLPSFLLEWNYQLGIKERLRDFQIKEKDFSWIAENSFSGSMFKNPRPVKVEDLKEILRSAW